MKNYMSCLKMVCLTILSFTVFMSCNSEDDGSEQQTTPGLKVVENATRGKVLVDQDNRALYFFCQRHYRRK